MSLAIHRYPPTVLVSDDATLLIKRQKLYRGEKGTRTHQGSSRPRFRDTIRDRDSAGKTPRERFTRFGAEKCCRLGVAGVPEKEREGGEREEVAVDLWVATDLASAAVD